MGYVAVESPCEVALHCDQLSYRALAFQAACTACNEVTEVVPQFTIVR